MFDRYIKKRKIEQIEKETEMFSLYNFLTKRKNSSAVIIITPDKTIKRLVPEGYCHGSVIEDSYKAIYSGFKGFDDSHSWEKTIEETGNIIFQLTNVVGNFVYIPSYINEYQLEEVRKINDEVKTVEKYFKLEIDKPIYYFPAIDRISYYHDLDLLEMELSNRVIETNNYSRNK